MTSSPGNTTVNGTETGNTNITNVQTNSTNMWFEISITLFVVVGLFLLLLIVCFIRQRRLLKNTFSRSFSRKSKTLPESGRKSYSNSGYDEELITRPKHITEDFGTQSLELGFPKIKNSKYESGFVSNEGSLINRQRNDNIYEPDLHGVERINETVIKKSSTCIRYTDRQPVFKSIHRRISEEDVIKVENEVQMRDPELIVFSNSIRKEVVTGKQEITYQDDSDNQELYINNANVDLSDDENYENCEHLCKKKLPEKDKGQQLDTKRGLLQEENSLPVKKQRKLINESSKVENPIYAVYGRHDDLLEDELSLQSDESFDYKSDGFDQPLYQNQIELHDRKASLTVIQDKAEPSIKNFINFKWDYKAHVHQNGGLLKANNSDIKLCLPNKFISAPETYIYWSIFAQDSEIKAKSNLESNLCVVSPVVEYYTPYKNNFDCYVVIELPHCISEHTDNSIQPYWFDSTELTNDGKFKVQKIPLFDEVQIQSGQLPDVFYLKKHPGFVTIYTLHFSVYFCACSQSFPLELYAVTFGKYVPIDHSQVNIKIKVHIADSKITLKDCLEALKQDEQSLGYHFKGKTEIELLDDDKVSGSDAIEIRVDFEDVPRNMNIVWKHSVDKEGSLIHPISKQWNFSNRFKCGTHKFIQTTKEWQFKNESPPRCRTVFQCFIDIIYKRQIERVEEKSLDDSVDFQAMVNNEDSATPLEVIVRTRMTVDIDLSDTVIENTFSESTVDSFASRRGVLPNIIYEIIDSLDDERFDEMCRRLGAERELKFHKSRGNGGCGRGTKYDLLDNIRDGMSDGRFCREILSVVVVMKEKKLKQSISEHIKKATHESPHTSVSIEPQPYYLQTPRPGVENEDHETKPKNLL